METESDEVEIVRGVPRDSELENEMREIRPDEEEGRLSDKVTTGAALSVTVAMTVR